MKMNIQVAGESGVGTYMIVSTEVWTAKSTPVTGEWTDDTEKEAVDEIAMALSDNEANLLYAEYDSFVEARKNAEAEAAYRAEHPEEFETHSMDESDGIMSASIPEPQAE